MGKRMTPVEAAKELGLRPQQVYGFIKHGRLKTFPNPGGKTQLVDFDEVKAQAGSVKHHRPKGADGKPIKRTAKLERGSIFSYHGKGKAQRSPGPHRVAVVTNVVKDDEGEESLVVTQREGTMSVYWETESLADKISKGQCTIESPEKLLAVVMYHYAHNEKPELAAALQLWAESNSLEVPVIEEQVETPA